MHLFRVGLVAVITAPLAFAWFFLPETNLHERLFNRPGFKFEYSALLFVFLAGALIYLGPRLVNMSSSRALALGAAVGIACAVCSISAVAFLDPQYNHALVDSINTALQIVLLHIVVATLFGSWASGAVGAWVYRLALLKLKSD